MFDLEGLGELGLGSKQNSNDQTIETECRTENLDDENFHKQRAVLSIGKSTTGACNTNAKTFA